MEKTSDRVLVFSAEDPFPLFHVGTHSYSAQQLHSDEVDRWLGFRIAETEQLLSKKNIEEFERKEMWVGLKPAALQTPYTEIRAVFERLKPAAENTVIDLGAGYGRMAHVMARHFPGTRFIGYERSAERAKEGRRILLKHGLREDLLVIQDLADPDFSIPQADFYFMYDFGTKSSIERVLGKLKASALRCPVRVIGRGRASRDLIEHGHPWLSKVLDPEHHDHFSIYRSA